jgi:hypothetical protein
VKGTQKLSFAPPALPQKFVALGANLGFSVNSFKDKGPRVQRNPNVAQIKK